MNNLALAFRSLFKKGQNNIIKILSLGTGLAVGLVLISKVFFDNSYDDFFPDNDRIYMIESNVERENSEPMSFTQVSGAIAPGMQAKVPGIEGATRYTYLSREGTFYTPDKKNYEGTFILADSCLFDILPRPMISGNAKEILSRPMYAIVSRSIAETLGGDPIGKTLEIGSYPGREITVGGVFEDIPENSHLEFDVVISLSSISKFTWDGTKNWLGNDRYLGYVKLAPNVSPESLAPAVRKMQEKYQDIEAIKERGTMFSYSFISLTKIHSDTPEAKRMTILLLAIAFTLIFTAVMNYILIVISTLVGRAKSIAVYKCYGATENNIYRLVFTETALHLVLSLFISVLLIFCFRGTVEELLSASVYGLFSLRTCFLLLIVVLLILFFVGFIPSYIFARIPVASAFRNLRITRRGWKMVLLFVQLMATAFLVNLLVIVSKQYDVMVNDNPGYTYDRVLHCSTAGVDVQERQKFIDELNKIPEVEKVSTSSTLLFREMSGNNVTLPGDDRELFNIADQYSADENYFPLLEIPIVEGEGFSKTNSTINDILVSKSFAEKISLLAGWSDGVIGKNVQISEHSNKNGPSRIVGVYPNIRIGSISDQDNRPSAIFYGNKPSLAVLIKLRNMNPDNIAKVYNTLKTCIPDKEIALTPYKDSMVKLYSGSRLFRNSIIIGGIVTLIITLIGLIGYTNNEVNRRRGEIAIRKVNGATLREILKLFVKDNLWVAVPSLICGALAAAIAGIKWMEDFSEKVELTPWLFLGCGVTVLSIVLLVVVANCMKVANQNPVETLQSE